MDLVVCVHTQQFLRQMLQNLVSIVVQDLQSISPLCNQAEDTLGVLSALLAPFQMVLAFVFCAQMAQYQQMQDLHFVYLALLDILLRITTHNA